MIETIDLDARLVMLKSGATVPITNLYDEDGDDCGIDEAVVCVAGDDEHGWFTIVLAGLEAATVLH